jgi:hypothetical protein
VNPLSHRNLEKKRRHSRVFGSVRQVRQELHENDAEGGTKDPCRWLKHQALLAQRIRLSPIFRHAPARRPVSSMGYCAIALVRSAMPKSSLRDGELYRAAFQRKDRSERGVREKDTDATLLVAEYGTGNWGPSHSKISRLSR